MWKVVTNNGGTLHKNVPGEDKPLTKAAAEKLAKGANERAEKLGIETRYEVKDLK